MNGFVNRIPRFFLMQFLSLKSFLGVLKLKYIPLHKFFIVMVVGFWLTACDDSSSANQFTGDSQKGFSRLETAQNMFTCCTRQLQYVVAIGVDGKSYLCREGLWIETTVDEDDKISVMVPDVDGGLHLSAITEREESSSSEKTFLEIISSSGSSSFRDEVEKKRWIPENVDAGSIYDEETHTLTDLRDGQVYRTVQVEEGNGTLGPIWMIDNLNYAYLQPTVGMDSSSFCYRDSQSSCDSLGRFYFWSAAMDSAQVFNPNGEGCGFGSLCKNQFEFHRGVCPEGWHIPIKRDYEKISIKFASSYMNFEAAIVFANDSALRDYHQVWGSEESDVYKVQMKRYTGDDFIDIKTEKSDLIPVRCVKDYAIADEFEKRT